MQFEAKLAAKREKARKSAASSLHPGAPTYPAGSAAGGPSQPLEGSHPSPMAGNISSGEDEKLASPPTPVKKLPPPPPPKPASLGGALIPPASATSPGRSPSAPTSPLPSPAEKQLPSPAASAHDDEKDRDIRDERDRDGSGLLEPSAGDHSGLIDVNATAFGTGNGPVHVHTHNITVSMFAM